jgi:hypothetical protein
MPISYLRSNISTGPISLILIDFLVKKLKKNNEFFGQTENLKISLL